MKQENQNWQYRFRDEQRLAIISVAHGGGQEAAEIQRNLSLHRNDWGGSIGRADTVKAKVTSARARKNPAFHDRKKQWTVPAQLSAFGQAYSRHAVYPSNFLAYRHPLQGRVFRRRCRLGA